MQACPTDLPLLSEDDFWLDLVVFDYPCALAFDYHWSNSSDKSASTGKFEQVKHIFCSRIFKHFLDHDPP